LVLGLIVLVILPFGIYGTMSGVPTAPLPTQEDVARITAASATLKAGARVLGHYRKGGTWHAGSLQSVDGQSFQIAYDDDAREAVTADSVVAEDLVPANDLAVDDRVLARWWNGSAYYLGVVTRRRPGQAHIRYDDGYTEWNKRAVVRLAAA